MLSMIYDLTPEQQEAVRYVREETGNLAITARAGTGKTTTVAVMAEQMRENSALCLAFNRAIAEEMKTRLPDRCVASTLNSLGHRAWGASLGIRTHLDQYKVSRLVDTWVRYLPRAVCNGLDGDAIQIVKDVVALGKRSGFLPTDVPDADPVYTEHDFFDDLDYDLDNYQRQLVVDVSRASWEEALLGVIDFDDQILCPTLYRNAYFRSYPITFVDEAQDLSRLNHRMAEKIVGNNRFVIVGDPYQAIYAFRGAEEDSMEILIEKFNMAERKLTVSFRCDQAIVRNVHKRAPDMKWREDAGEGEVRALKSWGERDVPDYSAIICRNNAPLFSVFISLIQAGRRPALGNKEVVYRFVKIMGSLGQPHTRQDDVMARIDGWERKSRRMRKDVDAVTDDALCLRAIAGMFNTLGEAVDFLRECADRKGNIMLSTVHKAKGLEFDEVFILDQELIRADGQEPNIRYVAETRAKHVLNYVTSDGYAIGGDDAEDLPVLDCCAHCNAAFTNFNELADHAKMLQDEADRLTEQALSLSQELVA